MNQAFQKNWKPISAIGLILSLVVWHFISIEPTNPQPLEPPFESPNAAVDLFDDGAHDWPDDETQQLSTIALVSATGASSTTNNANDEHATELKLASSNPAQSNQPADVHIGKMVEGVEAPAFMPKHNKPAVKASVPNTVAAGVADNTSTPTIGSNSNEFRPSPKTNPFVDADQQVHHVAQIGTEFEHTTEPTAALVSGDPNGDAAAVLNAYFSNATIQSKSERSVQAGQSPAAVSTTLQRSASSTNHNNQFSPNQFKPNRASVQNALQPTEPVSQNTNRKASFSRPIHDFPSPAASDTASHQIKDANDHETKTDDQVQLATLSSPVAPATPAAFVAQGGPSTAAQGSTSYRLADQPKIGDRWKSETPTFDRRACEIEACVDDFSPDPIDEYRPYDPYLNQQVYEGKQLNATQRPLLELGRPWYQLGQLPEGSSILGHHNNVNPQFLIFGDYRQAYSSNTIDGDNRSQMAFELNTFWNLFITSTERVVVGVAPLDGGGQNTRWEFDNDQFEFETDFDFDFGYLEGDLGAIVGGFVGETLPFDAPFAIGLTPMFIQNGVWLNDAVEGVFFTIPARNSPRFNISNMDITFAFIHDQIDSAAFQGDNSAAKAYGIFTFIEALNGYFEIDYAFLEDRTALNRSYHNIGLAYTRRFGRFISHSTRVIANAGQNVSSGDQTADGVLLLSENSLITRNPYTVVPYFNFFAGFDTPQSFAGDGELVNTGILFESDGMTGFPTLDASAKDTFGYAVGLNLLAQDFSQQLILETAAVFRNDGSDLPGDQFGIGTRYQLPLSNSWIFRTDSMYGFFRGDDNDDFGMRVELRKKF